MKKVLLLLFITPVLCFSQETVLSIDSIFSAIPFKGSEIIYEEVIKLDSINDKVKVFNAAKAVLIKNTNYKYTKIDEDRISSSINTEISFSFIVKPGIARFTLNAQSKVSIEVKENRFRVRIYQNTAKASLMGEEFNYEMEKVLQFEKDKHSEGKLKYEKSMIAGWHKNLETILKAFSTLIKEGVRGEDDF